MKKVIFSCLFLLTLLLRAQSQIVITEIMYNPPESGADSLEYIEVLNKGNTALTMSGWTLEFGSGPTTFAIPDLTIGAGQYQLFSVSASAMLNNFGKASVQWTTGGLSNNGAPVRFKDGAGTIVDEVVFDDAAPWPTSPDGGGTSLVLCDPNSDNSLAENWAAAITPTTINIGGVPVFANPGAASGCATGVVALPDVAFIIPGQSFNIDVVENDVVPPTAGTTTITITAPPTHGTATVSSDTSILYVPANGFCGQDVLTYRVCDSNNNCSTATVTINVKCYPVRTIGEMNNVNAAGVADSINASCELTGIVYGVNIRASSNGLQFTLIDESGTEGITTFRGLGNFGYNIQEGDKVTLRGSISQFNGLTQVAMDTLYKENSGNPLITPPVVLRVDESTENRLVQIKNLRYVDVAQWTPGTGSGFTVRVYSTNNPADTIAMRIDNDVDLFNASAPSEPFHVTGLGGQFDSSNPFTSGYQLLPRYTPDINTMVGTSWVNYSASVQMSPNPVVDQMDIRTTEQFDRITVFGLDGKAITTFQNPSSHETVSLAGMPAGVYAVRFEKNNTIWAAAVVKQ